ncbi:MULTISPECIES: hypothetical protein [unclassified Moraxella]|uniref:hypothetical protein n=1 Tax=unclassified Moraxella TaxID=2685852 RepID=UPI00359EE86B
MKNNNSYKSLQKPSLRSHAGFFVGNRLHLLTTFTNSKTWLILRYYAHSEG